MLFATYTDDTFYHLAAENGRSTICGKPTVEDAGARSPRPRRARERPDNTGLTLCPRCKEEAKDTTGTEKTTAERRLDALIDQLPVGVLFRDPQGRCTESNQKVCDILGVACTDLVGTMADDLFKLLRATKSDGTPLKSGEAPGLVAVGTRRPTAPVELLITTPGGEVRRIVARAAPVALDSEEPFGSVVVVTDVTESRTLQQQLQQAQRVESIGVLAGGVAHDFNNILTAILGQTQLALRGLRPEDALHPRLLEIERAANRAAELTRQLLAFGRRQRLERKVIDLNGVINNMAKMLERIIGEDVEMRVAESLNLRPVFADPAQLEQIVMNLAINARDAMPGGGQLIIETRNVELDEDYHRKYPYVRPGRYVQLMISDTGVGMDAETRRRIFEPFFTTKEVGSGTGLGLAMVYGIVKQHEGYIEVASEAWCGTTFTIYLPAEERAVEEEAQETRHPLSGGTETILVAEDEESLRALAKEALEDFGYTVILAKDGAEAIEMYKANRDRVDLVIMDVVMPRMGGSESYERMRQLGAEVPAIFASGYSAELVQSGEAVAEFIQKPFSVETLCSKVREVLDARKAKSYRRVGRVRSGN